MAIKRVSKYQIEKKGFYPVGVETNVDHRFLSITQYQDGHPDGTKMSVVIQFDQLVEFILVLNEIRQEHVPTEYGGRD